MKHHTMDYRRAIIIRNQFIGKNYRNIFINDMLITKLEGLYASVNMLVSNLTEPVHTIAEVATAVTRGDLSRSIRVGERRGGRPAGAADWGE